MVGSELLLLLCRGHVRTLGLSPNQLVHIPGAGDFQIARVYGPSDPSPDVGEMHSGMQHFNHCCAV